MIFKFIKYYKTLCKNIMFIEKWYEKLKKNTLFI